MHALALTTFPSGLNVTNGSTRAGGSPATPKSAPVPIQDLAQPRLTPGRQTIRRRSLYCLGQGDGALALLLLWLHIHVRSARNQPLGGLIRRLRDTWAALAALQQGLHRDTQPPTFLEAQRFHTLDGGVTYLPRLSHTITPRAARVGLPKITSLPGKNSARDRIHHHRPHIVCKAVLTGHDFCFTSTNLLSDIFTYRSSVIDRPI